MTGTQLKKIRERELGLTQEQLADALAKHPQTISDYEREKKDIPRVVALALRALVLKPELTTASL